MDNQTVDVLTNEERLTQAGYDPSTFRLLTNGAIYDNEKGRIVANIGYSDGLYPINKDNWKDIHKARKERRIQIAQSALEKETGIRNIDENASILTQAMVRLAMDGQNTAAVKAYSMLMGMLDLLDNQERQASSTPGVTISSDSIGELRQLLETIRDLRKDPGEV